MEHIENGAAEQQRLIITEQEAGQRADVGLAAMLELTRSNMQKLLEEGRPDFVIASPQELLELVGKAK
jgi:hypothetical protein